MGPSQPHADNPWLQAVRGEWTDNVAAWNKLRVERFPEAAYTYRNGWFIGSFRDEDDVMRERDLGALIARLMAREPSSGISSV
jgi:hypothetical protein